MRVYVNLKKIGKNKNSVEKVAFVFNEDINTVSDLITATVKICVKEYNEKKEKSELLDNISKSEIEDMASSGKISFGVNYGEKDADLVAAIQNALQCFEDGIFRIFANNISLEKLDSKIVLKENDELTFVRLTMLSGRMW